MDKKSLISKQILIILWLLAAAISCIEATSEFRNGGFSNWRFYFFLGIFIISAIMYFVRKKQRFEDKNKEI